MLQGFAGHMFFLFVPGAVYAPCSRYGCAWRWDPENIEIAISTGVNDDADDDDDDDGDDDDDDDDDDQPGLFFEHVPNVQTSYIMGT